MRPRLFMLLMALLLLPQVARSAPNPTPPPAAPAAVMGIGVSDPAAKGDGELAAATVQFIGIRRFTMQEYADWLVSNGTTGSDISANQGRVFLTDYRLGHIVRINGANTAANGDVVESRLINPEGAIASTLRTTYNSSTKCWTGIGTTCDVTFITFGFFYNPRRPCGTWTCEVYFNNSLVSADDLEMVGYILQVTDGDGQEGLQGSALPDPLKLQVLGFENEPVPDERVTFQVSSLPNGTKDGGLTDAYHSPPSGTTAGSLLDIADANGFAETYLELGSKSGEYTVTATSTYYDDRYPPLFTETAEKLTLGVTDISATKDVGLPGYADPVFQAVIHDGMIEETRNNPFGAALGLAFDLELSLAADPETPSWSPTVQWKYRVGSTGKSKRGTTFTGWEHTEGIVIDPEELGQSISNSDFGPGTFNLSFTFYDENGARLNTQSISMDLWLFFDKYGDDDGDGIPNWFQYWNETAAAGFVSYDGSLAAPDYGYTELAFASFPVSIGPLASTSAIMRANGVEVSGIDCFATTVIHELQHVQDYSTWWPGGYTFADHPYDMDQDRVPDILEAALGFDPALADSDADGISDSEESAYDAELTWDIGSADAEDWAWPGKQTDPSYAPGPPPDLRPFRLAPGTRDAIPVARLGEATPNPFRASTEVMLSLTQPGAVRWRIVDVQGRTICSAASWSNTGSHRIGWDGRDTAGAPVARGMYFLQVEAPGLVETRKLLRLE